MIRTQPMPDEVAAGHMGRLRWLNNWSYQPSASCNLKRAAEAEGIEVSRLRTMRLLAASTQMHISTYACLHSMLPALRVAQNLGGGEMHGLTASIDTPAAHGRGMPRMCKECTAEDLNHWGFSWFRRAHQLSGVDWCEKHGSALAVVRGRDPYWMTPASHFQTQGLSLGGAYVDHLADASGFVQRFVQISSAALSMRAPQASITLNPRLTARARRLGLATRPRDDSQRISHRIRKQAPKSWLQRHFPELASRTGEVIIVDKLLRKLDFAPEGKYYFLAMAALYDDADTALREVFGSDHAASARRFPSSSTVGRPELSV